MSTLVDHHYFDTPRDTAPESDVFNLYSRPSLDESVKTLTTEVITPKIVVSALWTALLTEMSEFVADPHSVNADHFERLGRSLAGAIRNAQEAAR